MPKNDDPTEIEPRPAPPRAPGAHDTTDQLRADIISGATGSKVAASDPAAAPLGTDAEAAGAPPSPGLISVVRRTERAAASPPQQKGAAYPEAAVPGARRFVMIIIGLAALGVLAAVIGFR